MFGYNFRIEVTMDAFEQEILAETVRVLTGKNVDLLAGTFGSCSLSGTRLVGSFSTWTINRHQRWSRRNKNGLSEGIETNIRLGILDPAMAGISLWSMIDGHIISQDGGTIHVCESFGSDAQVLVDEVYLWALCDRLFAQKIHSIRGLDTTPSQAVQLKKFCSVEPLNSNEWVRADFSDEFYDFYAEASFRHKKFKFKISVALVPFMS